MKKVNMKSKSFVLEKIAELRKNVEMGQYFVVCIQNPYKNLEAAIAKKMASKGFSFDDIGVDEKEIRSLFAKGYENVARYRLNDLRKGNGYYLDESDTESSIKFLREALSDANLTLDDIGTSEDELGRFYCSACMDSAKKWMNRAQEETNKFSIDRYNGYARDCLSKVKEYLANKPVEKWEIDGENPTDSFLCLEEIVSRGELNNEKYEVSRSASEDSRNFTLRAQFYSSAQEVIIWRNPDGTCRILAPLKENFFVEWDGTVLIFKGVVPEDEQVGYHAVLIANMGEQIEPFDFNNMSPDDHVIQARKLLNKMTPENSTVSILKINVKN